VFVSSSMGNCDSEANRILVVTECASPTQLEVLIPDVVFVTNEVEEFDRLYMDQHPQ